MATWITDEASNLGMRVQIPSGPFMSLRMPLAAVGLLLLLLPAAHPLFLVGEGLVGESISVLCENQERVFVSPPSGQAEMLPLDSDFQAEFVPEVQGPHTVQCGREAKTVDIAPAEGTGAGMAVQKDASLAFISVGMLLAGMLAALIFAARSLFSSAQFTKRVEGNRARIFLKAGKKLEKVEIEDPVSFSYAGKPLHFSIPALKEGREWSWEYEIALPEKALPASLDALEGGKKVSMLSRLAIEGKEKETSGHAHAGGETGEQGQAWGTRSSPPTKTRRALPKAR